MKQLKLFLELASLILALVNYTVLPIKAQTAPPNQEECQAQQYIYNVAVSPDNSLIAAVWNETSIQIWDIRTGKRVKTLRRNPILYAPSIYFSSDSKFLLLGGDTEATLWDWKAGKIVQKLFQDTNGIADGVWAYFVPNTQYIVTVSHYGATLWNRRSNKPIAVIPGFTDNDHPLQISPNGQYMLIADAGYWDLWDISTQKKYYVFEDVVDAAFTPDNKSIITNGALGLVQRDIQSLKVLRTLSKEDIVVRGFDFSQNSKYLLILEPSTLELWNLESSSLVHQFELLNNPIVWKFLSNEELLLIFEGSTNPEVSATVWSLSKNLASYYIKIDSNTKSIYLLPDNKSLLFDTFDKKIKLWNMQTQTLEHQYC